MDNIPNQMNGNALALFLSDKGMTHEAFAKVLRTSRAHVTKLASGSAYPSRRLMTEIDRATDGAVPVTSWFPDDARGVA